MSREKLQLLWRPILLIVVVAALFSLVRTFNLVEEFDELRNWIDSLGPWGPFVFVALFSVGILASFPTPVLKVGAVVLFGLWKGAIVIIVGITLGASLAFIISRYLARDSIASWLSAKKKFRKLDNLTEKYGAGIVAITRLIPIIPFSVQNYGFGLTKVRFRTYVALSFICMIPNTILYTVGTDIFLGRVEDGHIKWGVAVIAGLTLTFLALVAYFASRYLKESD